MEFWAAPSFESIGDAIDGFKELSFETTVDFTGGEFYDGEEETPVSLKYEKLFGFYTTCFSLCHDWEVCPLKEKSSEKTGEEGMKSSEGRYEAGGLEDRARSYKGVVINGNSGQKNKERDHREYQGKGKGKMFEEPGSKWVKGAERDTKRYNSYNGGYRGDEGGSRHRSNHREATRALEDRVRFSRGLRRERNRLGRTGEEAREEGEVRSQGHRVPQKENMVLNSSLPSLAFQAQLALTQADPKEVLTDPLEGANGLDSIHESVEEMHALVVGEGMDLDAVLDKVVQEGSIEELENEFQNLTDEEFEEDAKEKENGVDILEEENQGDEAEEKDQNAGDLVKKQGVRKKLYKPTVAAGGATMMRMVQAVRKRAAAKAGAKQTEEKGTSNPKSGPPKP